MWPFGAKFRHRVLCEADELMEYYGWRAYDVAWKKEQAAREKLRLFQLIFYRRVAEEIWKRDRVDRAASKPYRPESAASAQATLDAIEALKLRQENRLH